MGEPAWTIRAAGQDDAPALVDLFKRTFGKTITEAHWSWKLARRMSPVPNVWVACDGDRIVSQCAGIPVRLKIGDRERLGMVSVDAMTDPAYRRRGLLTELGRETYARWREAGVAFTIGLPNEQWGSRTAALGWMPLFRLHWLVRVVRPATVFARRLRLPAVGLNVIDALWSRPGPTARDSDVRVSDAHQIDGRFDALWQNSAEACDVSVVRDRAWIEWRYLASPDIGYRLSLVERAGRPAGYFAWRIDTRAGIRTGGIAELVAIDQAATTSVIHAAVDRLRAEGMEMIRTLAVPQTPTHRAFLEAGFSERESFSVELVALDPDLPLALLRDPSRWQMHGGDFDVI